MERWRSKRGVDSGLLKVSSACASDESWAASSWNSKVFLINISVLGFVPIGHDHVYCE